MRLRRFTVGLRTSRLRCVLFATSVILLRRTKHKQVRCLIEVDYFDFWGCVVFFVVCFHCIMVINVELCKTAPR